MDPTTASAAEIAAALASEHSRNYYFSFGFGALIILLFARDQFNRPSYEGARELTRLIELLAPSAMRRRNVFWRAYAFYAGILLLIYAILCIYGLVLGPTLGWTVAGYEQTEQEQVVGASALPPAEPESGYNPDDRPPQEQGEAAVEQSASDRFRSDPKIPLVVSLIMVGLAPSFPLLVRVEQKIRFVAHQLSGIPTRLIAGARKLHETPLQLGDGSADTLLIAPKDWRKLAHYVSKADVDDSHALHDDLEKIMAFRSWVLQEKLATAHLAARDNLAKVETDVRKAVERLVFSLDALSGFEGASEPRDPSEKRAGEADAERRRIAWEAAAREADQVGRDISVLSMLYVEHGVLPTEDTAEAFGWAVNPGKGAADQHVQKFRAEQKLMRHLSAAVHYVDRETFAMSIWVRATAAVLVISLFFGIFGADSAIEQEESFAGGSRAALGLVFMVQGALTYGLALLVGISWHQSAYRTNAWSNVFEQHWARWLPPLVAVFLIAFAAAMLSVVGLNIATAIGAVGVDIVIEKAGPVLLSAFEYEGPRALLGPILCLFVLLIVDAWRSGEKGADWLRWLPWVTGAAMFVTGTLARLASSRVGLLTDDKEFLITSWEVWKPAVQAGVWAGLVGLAVAFFVRGTLQHELTRTRRPDPTGEAVPGGA